MRKEKDYGEALKTLKKFSKRALKASIIPALHNHLRTPFETEEEVVKALEKVEGLKLCFDTAHARAVDIDSINFIKKHHDKIVAGASEGSAGKGSQKQSILHERLCQCGDGIVEFSRK